MKTKGHQLTDEQVSRHNNLIKEINDKCCSIDGSDAKGDLNTYYNLNTLASALNSIISCKFDLPQIYNLSTLDIAFPTHYKLILSLMTEEHVNAILYMIQNNDLRNYATQTINHIQYYTNSYNRIFSQLEFWQYISESIASFDPISVSHLALLASNLLSDDDSMLNTIIETNLIYSILENTSVRTGSVCRLLSLILMNPDTETDLILRVLNAFTDILLNDSEKISKKTHFFVAIKFISKQTSSENRDFIVEYIQEHNILNFLIKTASLEIERITVDILSFFENVSFENSLIMHALNAFDYLPFLCKLMQSGSNAIECQAMRCISQYARCDVDFAAKVLNAFNDFDFVEYFQKSTFYVKQCITQLLTTFIHDLLPCDVKDLIKPEIIESIAELTTVDETKYDAYQFGHFIIGFPELKELYLPYMEETVFLESAEDDIDSEDELIAAAAIFLLQKAGRLPEEEIPIPSEISRNE